MSSMKSSSITDSITSIKSCELFDSPLHFSLFTLCSAIQLFIRKSNSLEIRFMVFTDPKKLFIHPVNWIKSERTSTLEINMYSFMSFPIRFPSSVSPLLPLKYLFPAIIPVIKFEVNRLNHSLMTTFTEPCLLVWQSRYMSLTKVFTSES